MSGNAPAASATGPIVTPPSPQPATAKNGDVPLARASDPRGFESVHRDERNRLGLDPDLLALDGVGLALSGGGIRSASFALGVLQAMLNRDLLKRFDYLSTVSGGGYLGSAVSWWLHQTVAGSAQVPGKTGAAGYEAFRWQFGSKVQGARVVAGGDRIAGSAESVGSNWLAYLRQHGNYLEPPGTGTMSLVASVLRVCLYSLCVYVSAATGAFAALHTFDYQGTGETVSRLAEIMLLVTAIVLGLMMAAYGPATWLASSSRLFSSTWLYKARTRFRLWSGTLLGIALSAVVLWSVPWSYRQLVTDLPKLWTLVFTSTGLGFIGSLYQFWRGRARVQQPALLSRLRLIVTAMLVIYGLLLGAYALAVMSAFGVPPMTLALGCLAFSVLFGLGVNTNYAGIGRLYRDRLMEAFLPNPEASLANTWGIATRADQQAIAALAGRLEREGTLTKIDPPTSCPRPLQLVNCNVVLVDSPQDIYRTRGGDCFSISALWSGSNATGWVSTADLGDGAMSLSTAMSISGAAANPDSAPNGRGVTRNRNVSFLMSIFNARLGYWMANLARRRSERGHTNRPNLWLPGFRQGLLGRGLHERAQFLELTDGGHFDNTGVYELVRRRSKLIVICEAGQDSALSMDDLADVIEKVRVDFAVFIEFNDPTFPLEDLRPRSARPGTNVKRGFALGRVRYPKGSANSPDFDDGLVLYLQAVPIARMPADVDSFRRENPAFPNDSTADQFFDEQHLEAYRELGYAIAEEFFNVAEEERASASPSEKYLQRVSEILWGPRTPVGPGPAAPPLAAQTRGSRDADFTFPL